MRHRTKVIMRRILPKEELKSKFSNNTNKILHRKFKISNFEFGWLHIITSWGRQNLNNFITKHKINISDTKFVIFKHRYIIEIAKLISLSLSKTPWEAISKSRGYPIVLINMQNNDKICLKQLWVLRSFRFVLEFFNI